VSDNLISLREVSATIASRSFSRLLDSVEHEGDSYVIVRNGRPVARLEPMGGPGGRAVRELLATRPKDPRWSEELRELRAGVVVEERDWPA
jgi:prevent-host-death family protein